MTFHQMTPYDNSYSIKLDSDSYYGDDSEEEEKKNIKVRARIQEMCSRIEN